jgi:ribosome assembly protein YihI (activator of Der GTPase)
MQLSHLDELNALLDRLDDSADVDADADAYWATRDAALDLIDRYPELAEAGRSFGLPV